jgi:hypothetical protein
MATAHGNERIAEALDRVADLLEVQGASPFRVRAYRQAAGSVWAAQRPLADVLAGEGLAGLDRLPGVGPSIAVSIQELVRRGRLGLLDRLEGQISPEDLFTTIPGIGDTLARTIHRELGIETLEDLEVAAHDGRLERVRGFGPRRALLVREALGHVLAHSARRRSRRRPLPPPGQGELALVPPAPPPPPSVEALLDTDEEYRRRATAGDLRRIAPRRFNPTGAAWLPVLHTEREGFSITALHSNTARAHELGRTRDWVILYWERDGHEDQCTIVTETRGLLAGRRVVRGREGECWIFYAGDQRMTSRAGASGAGEAAIAAH